MRLQGKSISKLALVDLLRRKRKNLKTYLSEAGIVTYERLVRSCTSIGVVPPSEGEFMNALGNPSTPMVSSPTDGILVLEPPNDVVSQVDFVEGLNESEEEHNDVIHDDLEQQKSTKQQSKKRKKVAEDTSTD